MFCPEITNQMTKCIFACLFFVSLTTVCYSAEQQTGEINSDPEVVEILEEINNLIRDHYGIIRNNRTKPSAEALKAAQEAESISFTVNHAKRILNGMKRMWGYPVSDERIIPDKSRFWKMPIKYGFKAGDHTPEEHQNIRDGFAMWEDTTCVDFEEYNNPDELLGQPHLYIYRGTTCSSEVGCDTANQDNGRQLMSIGPDYCRGNPAVIAHEAGHALGNYHEMSRPDRDDYVAIVWDHILEGKEYNFYMQDDWDPENTGYDQSSCLHYRSNHFSIEPPDVRTIVPFDPYWIAVLGSRARLSYIDIKRVNIAYGCIEKNCKPNQLSKPCKNGGYQDPKNCAVCRCPPGASGSDCSLLGASVNGCGGEVFVGQGEVRQITLPTYPNPYPEDLECSWLVTTQSAGLIFAFEETPDMPCSAEKVCQEFVEIRSNLSALGTPGRFFCSCGVNKGRVAVVDRQDKVLVRFRSTIPLHGYTGKNKGFRLSVFATYNDTLASDVSESCQITESGFETTGEVSLPPCDHRFVIVRPGTPDVEGGASMNHYANLALILSNLWIALKM